MLDMILNFHKMTNVNMKNKIKNNDYHDKNESDLNY